ncbi:hypothetical protein PRCB_09225 [Pantoea rodasii]|uniref:Uncharacterized protein n=1 Tax=Pantoea rodasii TaxID=1076549 RepID=A0A2M9WEF3_9GAMM|nr:hypothetical protein [Pantoea rodasii]ORM61181.1 hypothetical protein HA45_21060 [Pantoea rodasii]PJZ05838.1 hypothetical protein PRCB_09225 [Pantoea rodasii]
MFAEIKDSSYFGYKKVAIVEFERVKDEQLIYGDRRYRLTLANSRVTEVVLNKVEWEKLEADSVRVL